MPLNKSSELKRRSLRANREIDDSSIEEPSANQEFTHNSETEYEHEPELQAEDSFVAVEEQSQTIRAAIPSSQTIPADDLLCVTPDTTINHIPASNKQIRNTIKQGEEEMAEVDTAMLSNEHGAIRHDIAVESARIGAAIGAESCGIQKHIGDVRMESAENFGHTRRDIQATSADAARQMGAGFSEVRYDIATRAGDIRREVAQGFDKTGDLVAATASDIRLEQQHQAYELSKQSGQEASEIIKEGLKATHVTDSAIKDTRYDLASRVENASDRLERGISENRLMTADRFYGVGRDLAELRQGQATLSKDIELNGLKGIIEAQKNTQYLADKIVGDGEKTRVLLNDHKYHDLNRALVERQAELVNCEQDRHGYRDRYWDARWSQNQDQFGAQFAAMQSQLQSMNQNFNSQLSETRQGMVNFGTMAGVGQTSSANNVR